MATRSKRSRPIRPGRSSGIPAAIHPASRLPGSVVSVQVGKRRRTVVPVGQVEGLQTQFTPANPRGIPYPNYQIGLPHPQDFQDARRVYSGHSTSSYATTLYHNRKELADALTAVGILRPKSLAPEEIAGTAAKAGVTAIGQIAGSLPVVQNFTPLVNALSGPAGQLLQQYIVANAGKQGWLPKTTNFALRLVGLKDYQLAVGGEEQLGKVVDEVFDKLASKFQNVTAEDAGRFLVHNVVVPSVEIGFNATMAGIDQVQVEATNYVRNNPGQAAKALATGGALLFGKWLLGG